MLDISFSASLLSIFTIIHDRCDEHTASHYEAAACWHGHNTSRCHRDIRRLTPSRRARRGPHACQSPPHEDVAIRLPEQADISRIPSPLQRFEPADLHFKERTAQSSSFAGRLASSGFVTLITQSIFRASHATNAHFSRKLYAFTSYTIIRSRNSLTARTFIARVT